MNMKKISLLLGIICFVFFLPSCSWKNESNESQPPISNSPKQENDIVVEPSAPNVSPNRTTSQEEFFFFTHLEWGYSLSYPIHWDFSTTKNGFPTFIGEKEGKDSIRPAVNITAESYPEREFSYPKMRSTVEKTLKSAYPDILFLNSTDEDTSSGKRAKLEYIATINSQKYHILQYLFLRGNSRYIFSFADSIENFEKNLPVAQKMADSFSFTKSDPSVELEH